MLLTFNNKRFILSVTLAIAITTSSHHCNALSQTNARRPLLEKQHPKNHHHHHHHHHHHDPNHRKLQDPSVSRSSFFAITAASTAAVVAGGPQISKAMMAPQAVSKLPETTINETTLPLSTTKTTSITSSVVSSAAAAAAADLSKRQSIAEFVAGAALGAVKTTIKYPLDSATVRLQMPNSEYSIQELGKLFRGSYDGITLSLLSNIPAGAVFFAAKDAVKTALKNSAQFQ